MGEPNKLSIEGETPEQALDRITKLAETLEASSRVKKAVEALTEPQCRKELFAVETFWPFSIFDLDRYSKCNKPEVFSGTVRARRYRMSVEEIVESDEVILERLLALWNGTHNIHHKEPLAYEAKKYGHVFDNGKLRPFNEAELAAQQAEAKKLKRKRK